MTAREEFNRILNSCYAPRAMYSLLSAMAHNPSINELSDSVEKRAVCLREIHRVINKSCVDESVKEAV